MKIMRAQQCSKRDKKATKKPLYLKRKEKYKYNTIFVNVNVTTCICVTIIY